MRRVLAVCLCLLGFSAPAQAATDLHKLAAPEQLTQSVTTQHFVVHYVSTAGDPNAISDDAAQRVAANAENALAVFEGWGYPAPLDDGDGHTDIQIFVLPSNYAGLAYSAVAPGTTGSQFSGYIQLTTPAATLQSVVAHELFHVIQYGMFAAAPSWLLESTARWAEHTGPWKDGWASVPDRSYFSHPEMPFDCSGDACPSGTWDGGYERWLFWSFLTDRYGTGFVHEYFDRMRSSVRPGAIASVTVPLDDVLKAHGTTLAQAWNDFTVANALRSYPAVAAGTTTVATQKVTVGTSVSATLSHLSAHYVELLAPTSACASTTLHVRVSGGSGIGTPYVVVGSSATAAVGGAADVAWSTCGAHPLVVLPNDSTGEDGVSYSVATSTGDTPPTTTTTGPTAPPAATAADAPPAISILGAASVLRLSSSRPSLALTLSANAPGRVELAFDGSSPFATVGVNPGTNVVRLKLARQRGARTLLLTPVSSGGTRGTPLRQTVVFR